ncbi:MarR family winged helix-turn-helix transcriptional regulator [Arachnia propionica]|uniref:MarR family winged helix-turn-helix transcriptional regulator n=1 Tax=Arachnia propionica TaxID=1750 RepID=UPI00163A8D88|nr:MarR family winged helix-turn-helix transcriptional regulator [Arachnia propionica]
MTETPRSPLATWPAYRLIKVGERAIAEAEARLLEIGIKPRHFNVLVTVAEYPTLSQRELSTALGIDPNVMVGVIDELEAAGLAQRQRSTVDRRRHVVVVTAEGRALLDRGMAALRTGQELFLAALDKAERQRLHDLVGKLLEG